MIVNFYRTMSRDNFYRARFSRNDRSSYEFDRDVADDKYMKKLKNELNSRFASLKMDSHIPFIFKFNDPADEAAFLLWSSEGIEL
jgi:hypothetical protein